MPLPRKRQIDCYINKQTVNDLIISHLHNIGMIRDTEEVTKVYVGPSTNNEVYQLIVDFEPETQVIFHE